MLNNMLQFIFRRIAGCSISFAVIFIMCTVNGLAQTPCPNYGEILNHGYASLPGDPHNPNQGGNFDEFGVTDPSPFILKVNDYPPVKAFQITKPCGTVYYFSFDTDEDYFPLNYNVTMHEENIVKTYRIDQNGNYTSGYSVIVTPPASVDVGYSSVDFLMKYNGTAHSVAWNLELYPFSNFVSTPVPYSPQSLQVEILGPNQISPGSTGNFTANINGGSGYYRIVWSARDLPAGTFFDFQDLSPSNYYTIPFPNGENYYFYDNEYKCEFLIDQFTYELKVSIYDLKIGNSVSAVKTISPTPEPVTFINHIQTSENFGKLILNENKLDPISSGQNRILSFGSNYTIRTDELPFLVNFNSTGKTEKTNHWEFTSPTLFSLNRNFTFLPSTERTMKSRFLSTDQAVIKTLIDGVECGTIEFKDPWFYYKDGSNNWYQSNEFKSHTSPLNLYNNTTTSYGGVFRDQGFPNWDPPYYSVKTPSGLYILQTGKTHPLYFLGWDYNPNKIGLRYPQSSETAVVFKDDNAELTVKLKGTQLSNEQNAYSNNSQRKTVRSDDGWLHNVYESMGRVWYETSSDNGATWTLANNGQPLDNGQGKHPSIDYAFFSANEDYSQIFIVYQEKYGSQSIVKVKYFHSMAGTSYSYHHEAEIATVSGSYSSTNITPVVGSYSGNFTVLWKNGTGSLYFRSGVVNISFGITMYDSYPLTGTNGNSINPAIHSTKTCCTWIKHIAWQENDQIKYSTQNGTTIGTIETPSSNSGYSENRYPSISLANGNPVLSWTVSGMPVAVIIAPKDNSERFTSKAIVRRKGTDWGDYQLAGNNVNFTNNNSVSSAQEKTVIVWSEGTTNPQSKWMKRTGSVYGGPCNLSHSGVQTQVITGSDYQYMTSMVFNNNQLPYYFIRTTTSFNQECSAGGELDKITNLSDSVVTYGRAGITNINDISFVFNVGDVIVGDSIVRFTEKPDTLVYSTYEELNQFTRTEDFQLNNSSQFYFSNLYYVVNKELADSSLTENDNVNFKVELVNSITGQVIGVFDNITYDKNNLEKYDNISYQVNCSGIQPGEYYLRLVTTVNGEADYALANIINETENLDKKHFQIINYDGSEMPVTYSLEQNYPNPFNPSTTIRYQIPNDGLVTLKVYDILGSEVATLVNEQKTTGRYEVNFDASRFASGVYIYKIQAGSYISSKKMLLVK